MHWRLEPYAMVTSHSLASGPLTHQRRHRPGLLKEVETLPKVTKESRAKTRYRSSPEFDSPCQP